MRGHVALRFLHDLRVVLHAGAEQPFVDFRLLEECPLALLVVGNGILTASAIDGRWLRMRRQIFAQRLDVQHLREIVHRRRHHIQFVQLRVDALQQFRYPADQTRNHLKGIFVHISKVFRKGRSLGR